MVEAVNRRKYYGATEKSNSPLPRGIYDLPNPAQQPVERPIAQGIRTLKETLTRAREKTREALARLDQKSANLIAVFDAKPVPAFPTYHELPPQPEAWTQLSPAEARRWKEYDESLRASRISSGSPEGIALKYSIIGDAPPGINGEEIFADTSIDRGNHGQPEEDSRADFTVTDTTKAVEFVEGKGTHPNNHFLLFPAAQATHGPDVDLIAREVGK